MGGEGIERGLVSCDGAGGLAVDVGRCNGVSEAGCCVFDLHGEGMGLRRFVRSGGGRLTVVGRVFLGGISETCFVVRTVLRVAARNGLGTVAGAFWGVGLVCAGGLAEDFGGW